MRKQIIVIICSVVILVIISAFIYKIQNNPIVGKWVSTKDARNVWVFKNSDKAKSYYNGKLLITYTYKLSRESEQCGYDMSKRLEDFPEESILLLKNTQNNKKKCYLVYKLSKNNLTISPLGYSTIIHFKKQK